MSADQALTTSEAIVLARQFLNHVVRPFEKLEPVLLAVQEAENQVASTRELLAGLEAEYTAKREALESELADLRGQTATARTDREALRRDLADLRTQVARERETLATAQGERQTETRKLEAARTEYEAFRRKFA